MLTRVEDALRADAELMRSLLSNGESTPAAFRRALADVSRVDRDAIGSGLGRAAAVTHFLIPSCPWLTPVSPPSPDLAVYRSAQLDLARAAPISALPG